MAPCRLTLATQRGAVSLPDSGRIAVFRPSEDHDLSPLPADRVDIIQGFRRDHDAWAARGYRVMPEVSEGPFALSVVMLPRAKAQARAMIAAAVARTRGAVVIDGQKVDGIDSVLRDCRKRTDVSDVIAKAHGKLFVMPAPDGFADWAAQPEAGPDGFVTAPGVFSADRVDHGSSVLAAALPATLGPVVADLGAGWGYLAAQVLRRQSVKTLHLIEAEHAALDCARRNIKDARAQFHWLDAASAAPFAGVDTVVTNPPFHVGRSGDPALGKAFIEAAARLLTPRGTLWLVANRHLPYETTLRARFRDVEEMGGDGGFKVMRAAMPSRPSRMVG